MASCTDVKVCRFCGEQNYATIDLIKTGLCEKLVQFFPLKFDITDHLPKMACKECASTIQQMEVFVLKAQEVEHKLMERSKRSAANTMSSLEIRSLVDSLNSKKTKPRQVSVNEILRKLNTSSIVIKKIGKEKPKHIEQDAVSNRIDDELLLKMKVEVLDEEVEHLPAGDFIHYDDTDDDNEEEAQVIARQSFQSIEAVNIKEMFSTDDSSQEAIPEERLEIEIQPECRQNEIKSEPRQLRSPVKMKPKPRPSNSKNVIINLTDPCHYVCVTCKGKFKSFEELQVHIDQNISCKKVNSTCEKCGKVCDSRRALYQHRQTHNPKPQLICDQCGKVYTNSFNLENHKSQVHGEEIEELGYVYKCCELTFPTRRELNEHIATHSKILNLLCDTCGKSFTSHKALRSHNMSHLNIRPFSCDMCDKSFRTKLLLVQHSHVHTGIKAFNCDMCEKSFAKKESLKRHYKLHSTEPVSWSSTGEKISVKTMGQLHDEQSQPYVEYEELQNE